MNIVEDCRHQSRNYVDTSHYTHHPLSTSTQFTPHHTWLEQRVMCQGTGSQTLHSLTHPLSTCWVFSRSVDRDRVDRIAWIGSILDRKSMLINPDLTFFGIDDPRSRIVRSTSINPSNLSILDRSIWRHTWSWIDQSTWGCYIKNDQKLKKKQKQIFFTTP